jgi:hypothetical protein
MHYLTLSAPIEALFAAEPNPDALASCFTSQAVMKDDGHTVDLSYRFRLEDGLIASLEITA